MKLKNLELSVEERAKLVEIVKKGSDWRARERAQTLLYFGDGMRAKAIAAKQELNLDTVYDRRKHWLAEGFASLADKHRSGAPSKLSEAHRELLRAWATEEALTAPALLAKLKAECDVVVHTNTLNATLKKMDFVWKRTRHSLKKRDEQKFRESAIEIKEMVAAAQCGEIEMAYVDEVGFAQAQPNRSAWTLLGERHMIDARRGQRLNIVGALLSSGGVFTVKLWETMTAVLFADFLGLLRERVGKPLAVILDNASVHKA